MADRRGAGSGRRGFEERHVRVAETLLRHIREGRAEWTQAWEPGGAPRRAASVATGREYRGGNSLWLADVAREKGWSDHRWGTLREVEGLGGSVRRGERGVRIHVLLDGEGEIAPDGRGGRLLGEVEVFNAEQCQGLPELPRGPRWARVDRAERILEGSGARIRHAGGDRAYFDLARDRIVLPHRDQFHDGPSYYQTALHELGHWTGHPARLDRETLVRGTELGVGSALYAREELRAEISSAVTCQRLNLGHDPVRHAGYVRGYMRELRNDPLEIYRAARAAYRISDYIFERVRDREPEREAGGRDGQRTAERRVREPSATARHGDPRPAAGERQRPFQRERLPEGRLSPLR